MVCRLAVQAPSPPEAPEYPRDDLNVRHTAPEAVALSGLSYGAPTDSTVAVLCRVLTNRQLLCHLAFDTNDNVVQYRLTAARRTGMQSGP